MDHLKHILVTTICFIMVFSEARGQLQPSLNAVQFIIIDSSTGEKTAARIRVTMNGSSVKTSPPQSSKVMYGMWDHADGYQFQPDSSFYVDGNFSLELETGDYEIMISKGFE